MGMAKSCLINNNDNNNNKKKKWHDHVMGMSITSPIPQKIYFHKSREEQDNLMGHIFGRNVNTYKHIWPVII